MRTNTKICLVTGQYPPQIGGVGHSAFRVANLLANNGFTVHVVAFQKNPVPLPFDECVESRQEDNVQVHRVKVFNPPLDQHEGMTEQDALTRYNREMFDALSHFQRLHNYDVLHAFFLYPAGFIAALVGGIHKTKIIASIRGNDVGKYAFDPLRFSFVKTALKKADYITSVATSLIELADAGLTPVADKAVTILNSIDHKKLQPTERPPLSVNGIVIGTIGLFRYKKGMVYLCKALGKLRNDIDFTLLLAGDYFKEEDRKPHLAYFEENGIADRVIVTGKVPHNQVANYIQMLDILVFPSLFSEGCPLSMLEAMAMGKPVIGTRSGAIPEIIKDGENGILVNAGSSSEIAAAIRRLVDDEPLRKRLADNAAATVANRTLDNEYADWLSVYEKVMQK